MLSGLSSSATIKQKNTQAKELDVQAANYFWCKVPCKGHMRVIHCADFIGFLLISFPPYNGGVKAVPI